MQELKNNTEGSGQDRRDLQPFDQQIQRLLTEAEVTPPPDLMDKMFEALETHGVSKDTDIPAASSLKGDLNKGGKTRVMLAGKLGSRLSYAAAIAGILMVLTMGIRELTSNNSAVLPPAGLTAINTRPDSPTGVRPEQQRTEKSILDAENSQATAKTATQLRAVDEQGHWKEAADKTGKRKAQQRQKMNVATSHTARLTAEDGAGTVKTAPSQAQQADITDRLAAARATTAGKTENHNTDPVAVSLPVEDHPEAVAAIDKNAAKALVTDQEAADSRDHRAVVLGERRPDADAGGRPARTRGLLKGLFRKISNSAKAISDDVVTQDENKTVINVGILAITAYK